MLDYKGSAGLVEENLDKSGVVTRENQLVGFVRPQTDTKEEDDEKKKNKWIWRTGNSFPVGDSEGLEENAVSQSPLICSVLTAKSLSMVIIYGSGRKGVKCSCVHLMNFWIENFDTKGRDDGTRTSRIKLRGVTLTLVTRDCTKIVGL
ncbi:unnamed protein product [Allacma fusca]|uniref:Uncharacterized protein n=1 Tax=Allacma fusca TaxID=39272 RepID=A0A8J2Q7U4_9HEXA|nr:unnamed protein product [Allacma fusca]